MFEYFKRIQEALINIWESIQGTRFAGYASLLALMAIYVSIVSLGITAFQLFVQPFMMTVVPEVVYATFGLVLPPNTVPCLIAYYTLRAMRTMFLFKITFSILAQSRLQADKSRRLDMLGNHHWTDLNA